jgi:hypothetical protein
MIIGYYIIYEKRSKNYSILSMAFTILNYIIYGQLKDIILFVNICIN